MKKSEKENQDVLIDKTKGNLKERIESKLITRGIADPREAEDEQIYYATVAAIKDIMLERRESFKLRKKASGVKKICYLCMEFLVGRSLKNVSISLGIYEELCSLLSEFGTDFEKVYKFEVDPGLGNGGLGRLAACFMDSLSAKDYAANGYSLLYENGFFKQKIIDGEQVELPDEWLGSGGAWLVPHPEKSVSVRLGGKIIKEWQSSSLKITNYEYDEVRAVPYDLLIPGTDTDTVNTIRLWRARPAITGVFGERTTQGSYIKNIAYNSSAEIITKQLYPRGSFCA